VLIVSSGANREVVSWPGVEFSNETMSGGRLLSLFLFLFFLFLGCLGREGFKLRNPEVENPMSDDPQIGSTSN